VECRFAVEAYCLSPGTPFSFNETTTHNRLEEQVLVSNT
jgi:hypothetical protein